MVQHLLVDYGEVISSAQPIGSVRAMAAVVDMPTDLFHERYWASRAAYDRGLLAHEYWELVIGRPLRADTLMELRRRDLASWTHLNFATIAALRDASRRGAQLTLLSNAPHDLADEVGRSAVLTEIFPLLLFSAQLRASKPSTEIFETALALAEASPEESLMVDDRAENLRAAEALGIRTHQFLTAGELGSTLRKITFSGPRTRRWASRPLFRRKQA